MSLLLVIIPQLGMTAILLILDVLSFRSCRQLRPCPQRCAVGTPRRPVSR